MKILKNVLMVVMIITVGSSNSFSGQNTNFFEDDKNTNRSSFKFRGKPKSECSNFMIYETGLLKPISGGNVNGEYVGIADLGLMNNINDNTAFGASLCFLADDNLVRIGLRPRFKKWLTEEISLDLSAGLFFNNTKNWNNNHSGGFILGSSVGFAELLSIDLLYHRYGKSNSYYDYAGNSYTTSSKESILYLGATGRSYTGIVVQAAAVVVLIVVLSTFQAPVISFG